MIILGLLLLLAATGLSLAAIQANRSVFEDSAGVVGLFGYSAEATVGEAFLAGAGAGALALVGFFMIIGGSARRARRRIAARRELRRQDGEVREVQAEGAERAKQEKVAARQERRAAAEQERAAQHRAAEEREEELASR